MSKKKITYQESGSRGGKIGGRSRSTKKKRASRLNLRRANAGRKVAGRIRKVEKMMASNRTAWLACENGEEEKLLDRLFEKLVKEREKLESLP